MTVLVTGGTGFIGHHLVKALVMRGERVRALVRRTSHVRDLKQLGVELIIGAIQSPYSVAQAIRGVDSVVHLAAPPDWRPYAEHWRTNFCGTRNMLRAAMIEDIHQFVHCSTIGVLGFARKAPLNEQSPYAPSPYSPYAKTKCQAEQEVLTASHHGLSAVVLRPAQVYGPRSTGTMGLALKYCTIMPLIGGGNALLQPIFVQDVVDAFLLAMDTKKTCGQIYNIAGTTQVSFRDWIATIAAALDVSPSRRSLSKRVAWILGHLMELKERILGGTILLTRFRVECLTNDMIYDISKAKQELKFTPQVGIDEGIQRTVAWYKSQNQT